MMKVGQKVVCLSDTDGWQLDNFIAPGGVPEKNKVYVIDAIYGLPDKPLGLSFVGGITAINKQFKLMVGFSVSHFKLLSEIQEENKKRELEFANPS